MRPIRFPLFVPGDRPDRFKKAGSSGADAVIIDLEDAVAAPDKTQARQNLADMPDLAVPLVMRINALMSPHHEADRGAVHTAKPDAVMVAKAEDPVDLNTLAESLEGDIALIPLIETARGLAHARDIAKLSPVKQLAFGSLDFALDIGVAHDADSLAFARFELVLASRLSGIHPPLDGITPDFRAPEKLAQECHRAKSEGFAGKLLIHPAQVAIARRAYRPSAEELTWAQSVINTSKGSSGGAIEMDGTMIDEAVVSRAERILADAEAGDSDIALSR